MTMAPIRVEDQEAAARASFEALLLLKKNLEKKGKSIELSMGMSEDYHLAMEYQTNWVRIGSKIFKT